MKNDLISRHEAIRDIRLMDVCVIYDDMCSTEEAVERAIVATKRTVIFGLDGMQSAQPEIIRCRDCKHYTLEVGDDSYALGYCPFIGSHLVMSKGFCAWGERRT